MKRNSLKTWIAILLCMAAGCSSLTECVVDMEMDCRNHVLAQKAWGHWSWCYDELDHPWHFAKGFKDGYRDILEGGSGCQPTLPPRCYWKPQFQNPEGRCRTAAWFDGFAHGALAAQQDGYGNLQEIPISPTARMNMNAGRATPMGNPFVAAGQQPGPVPDAMPSIPEPAPPASDELSPLLPTIGPNGEVEPVPVKPYED